MDDSAPPDDNPFASQTPKEALANLNRAIYMVETKGQRYTIGERELWRGDLRWMYPERARLEKIVNSGRRGGPRLMQAVPC